MEQPRNGHTPRPRLHQQSPGRYSRPSTTKKTRKLPLVRCHRLQAPGLCRRRPFARDLRRSRHCVGPGAGRSGARGDQGGDPCGHRPRPGPARGYFGFSLSLRQGQFRGCDARRRRRRHTAARRRPADHEAPLLPPAHRQDRGRRRRAGKSAHLARDQRGRPLELAAARSPRSTAPSGRIRTRASA